MSSAFNDEEKMFKHLYILSKLLYNNQNQCNTVNKQYSVDLDVASRVYLDNPEYAKTLPLIHNSIENIIIMYVMD